MNTKIKRFMSGILILVIIFSYVSVMARINATPNYSSAVSSYSELESRLNSLISKYNNTYWTSDGKVSNSSGDRSLYYYGIQCNGFAKLIFNDLFHCGSIGTTGGIYYVSNPNGAAEIARDTSVTADDAKRILSSGSKGDFIQVKRRVSGGPHSMILAGKDENGVWIFDCNSDGKCGVKYQYQSWATFANKNIAMSLYHATNYPQGGGNTYLDIGTNFYGVIFHKSSWKPITVDDDNYVRLRSEKGTADQVWKFVRQDDNSYVILSAKTGNALEMYSGVTDNGNPAAACAGDWGGNYQRWYLFGNKDGYVLKSKHFTDLNRVLDLAYGNTGEGTQIQTWEYNKDTTNQVFAIYTGGDICLQSPALNINVGSSATKTKFTWSEVYGELRYDVKIWKNKLYEGDAYHIEWGTNSGYEINLPAGTYQAYVDASNYFECKMSNVITFTVSDAVYNVNFNANGGSTPTSSKRVTYNSTYGDLPTPSRSGYRFLGWYTSASGGSRIESGTTFAITWDQTLYAHWSANSYNVVFNANGGSTPTSNKNVTYNSTYGDLPTPSRSGYRFLGWYTSANGGSRIESGTTVYITSNQTLYAQWERTAYTISYNTNGGSGVFESKTANLGSSIKIPDSVPVKDGYKFLGWAKAADAAYAEYRPGEQIAASGDMTLYAVWKIIPYTQTEIVNYGSYKIGTIQLNYVTAPAKIIIAQYKGNVFVGAEERDYKNSTETFAVIGDIDTVKIMVWEDMDGMTPVTSSEVKNF